MMGLSGGERAWGASRRSSQRHFWLFAHGAEACAGPTCCRTMTMPLRTVFTGCTEKIVTAGTGRRESTCGNGTHQATDEAALRPRFAEAGEERSAHSLRGGARTASFLWMSLQCVQPIGGIEAEGGKLCSTVAEMKPPLCL